MSKDPIELVAKLRELQRWKNTTFKRLAARRAEAYVRNNFVLQGYANGSIRYWQARNPDPRPGGAVLIKTAALRDSIYAKIVGNAIVVQSDKPYAKIHNEGGVINQVVTPRQRRFFFAQYNMSRERRWLNMALARNITINMPKRQFMPISDEGIPTQLDDKLTQDVEIFLTKLF